MERDQRFITSIERQKNRPRYNVYINDEYAFSIHEDILVKFRLSKGKEVAEEDIQQLLKAEEKHRAEQYALRYLGFKPRTATQLRNYLEQKGFEGKDCEAVVQSFIEKKYINDEEYASQWIEERKRVKPRGRYLLKQELIYRGVNETLVEDVMDKQLTDEEEVAMIIQLIRKKWKAQTFSSGFEMKKRVVPFLQRKGFPLELIFSAIHKLSDEFIVEEDETNQVD